MDFVTTPVKQQQSPGTPLKSPEQTDIPAMEPEPEAAKETPSEVVEPVVEKKREIKIPLALRRLFSSSNKSP